MAKKWSGRTFHFTLTYTLNGVKEQRRVFVSAELPRPAGAVTVEVVISDLGQRKKKELPGIRTQLPKDDATMKVAFELAKQLIPREAKNINHKNRTT